MKTPRHNQISTTHLLHGALLAAITAGPVCAAELTAALPGAHLAGETTALLVAGVLGLIAARRLSRDLS